MDTTTVLWEVLEELPIPIHPDMTWGDGYDRSQLVEIDVEGCVTFNASFSRDRSQSGCGEWKFAGFRVPEPHLEDNTRTMDIRFRIGNGYGYFTDDLDVALARAAEMFAKLAELHAEADRINREAEEASRAEEEREQKRLAAQRAAFHPFVYYRVKYGIIAEEDGEKYADTREFDSLTYTDEGYWAMVNGREIKLRHLVSVERIVCRDADDLPWWCPKVETEWGKIRVLPVGAMRV